MRLAWQPIVAITALVAVWEAAWLGGLLSPVICPSPLEVLHALAVIATNSRDRLSVGATVIRALEGTAILVVVGTPFGLVLSFYSCFLKFVEFPIDFVRAIPPALLVPLFFFASPDAGADNDFARIALLCFGCFPILLMQLIATARNIPPERLEFAASVGAGPWFIISKILIYEMLPNFFIALRTVMSFGIVIIIVTEVIYPPLYGIGSRVLEAQTDYGVNYTYAYSIIAGCIGNLLNYACLIGSRKALYWRSL